MLDDGHDLLGLGGGEGGGCRIVGHQVVEDGESDGAAGFVEERNGYQEAEGVVGKTFLY